MGPIARFGCYVVALAILVSVSSSCSRNGQDNKDVEAMRSQIRLLREELDLWQSRDAQRGKEIEALRDEITALRVAVEAAKNKSIAHTNAALDATAPPANTPKPELTAFMRVARRMVSASSTGASFLEFRQRLVELNASAEEVLSATTDRTQKIKISDFVLALNDAHSLWRYKISTERDRMDLRIIQGVYAPADFPEELGDRWNLSFADLAKKYGLRDQDALAAPILKYGDHSELLFNRALERILQYATSVFRELEELP
jgi:hypothetical protein